MGAGFHGGFGGTKVAKNSATVELVAGLEKSGVKFTKENIVFITKDRTGQTVWLAIDVIEKHSVIADEICLL